MKGISFTRIYNVSKIIGFCKREALEDKCIISETSVIELTETYMIYRTYLIEGFLLSDSEFDGRD